VVDASNSHFPEQIEQVQKVLHEIGAAEIPQLLVFNKLDVLEPEQRPAVLADTFDLGGKPVPRIFVSAKAAEGLDALRGQLSATVLAAQTLLNKPPESSAHLNGRDIQ
jgi:GTP-binding protein HflX